MAIDFKEKFAELKSKDTEPLIGVELNYIKIIESYIDSEIQKKLLSLNYFSKINN